MTWAKMWLRGGQSRGVVRSHTAEVAWDRVEELRPRLLGPSEEEITTDQESQETPWRPKQTLGKSPKI